MAQLTDITWPERVGFQAFAQWDTEFDVKQYKAGKPVLIEGYATSPNVDFCGDMLPPSAMAKHLDKYRANPLFTYCHNAMLPIGKCVEVDLDEKGLHYKAEVINDPRHELAQLAIVLIESGVVCRSSIGYDAIKQRFASTEGGRRIRILDEVQVHEIGAVPLAMNQETSAMLVKSWGLHMGPQGDEEVAPLVDEDAEWEEICAGMTTLLGDRGGIDLEPHDKRTAYENLAAHYERLDKGTPTFKGVAIGAILEQEVELPPYSDIEFHEGERGMAEATRVADYIQTIKGRTEGLANIVSASIGDGVPSDADGGVLSPDQLESVGVAHGYLGQVLDAHKPATETAKGVLSQEESLAICRVTGIANPTQGLRSLLHE